MTAKIKYPIRIRASQYSYSIATRHNPAYVLWHSINTTEIISPHNDARIRQAGLHQRPDLQFTQYSSWERTILPEIIQVSTNMVDPAYRTEYWRDVTRPLFDSLPIADSFDQTLEGSYKVKLFNPLMIGQAKFGPQQFSRSWRIISRSGLEDFYLMQFFANGTMTLKYDGPSLSIAKGDVYLFDFGKTFTSQCSAGSTYTFLLQRDRVEKAIPGKKLHGLLFKAGQPITQLLSNIITGIMDLATTISDEGSSAAEDAIISILTIAVHHNKQVFAPHDPVLIPILRARILEYIDTNLSEPTLSIDTITHRFRVSRAHLYRMFETEGGVVRAIRERRLLAAYKHLLNVPTTDIARLAERLGFSNTEQFQRAFQYKFEMTPKEAKQERSKLIVESKNLSDMKCYLSKFKINNANKNLYCI